MMRMYRTIPMILFFVPLLARRGGARLHAAPADGCGAGPDAGAGGVSDSDLWDSCSLWTGIGGRFEGGRGGGKHEDGGAGGCAAASGSNGPCENKEKPSHDVQISKGFWMGQTEVTMEAYKLGRKLNPQWSLDSLPMTMVDWNDSRGCCEWAGLRLPTEAEWVYAAHGARHRRNFGGYNETLRECADGVISLGALKLPVEFEAIDGDVAGAGRPGGLGHLSAPGVPGGAEILNDFRVFGAEIGPFAEVGFEVEKLGELIAIFEQFPFAFTHGTAFSASPEESVVRGGVIVEER